MRTSTAYLLRAAASRRCAVAAFNTYTIDQAAGVIDAANHERSPVILQVHPGGRRDLLWPLIAALRVIADEASVPVAVQLDHTSEPGTMARAVDLGVDSVMVDGSELAFDANVAFVRDVRERLRPRGVDIEAELGRIAGTEDGISIDERSARMTDPLEAAAFPLRAPIDALAICVGNVHGRSRRTPMLDLDRLRRIADGCSVPLVLHGASGLSSEVLARAIELGVAKVNVNTELREAYADGLERSAGTELVRILAAARDAAAQVAQPLIRSVRSTGLADQFASGDAVRRS